MVSHRIKTIKKMRRNFQNYFENIGAASITNPKIIEAYDSKDLKELRRLLAVDSYKKMVPFFLLSISRLEDIWLKSTKTIGEYLLVIFKKYLIDYYVTQLGYSQQSTQSMVDNLLISIVLDGASDIMCESVQDFINKAFILQYSTITVKYKNNTGSEYYQESHDRSLFEGFADILGNIIYGLPDYLLNQQNIKDYIIATSEIKTEEENTEHELAQENTERVITCIHRFLKTFLTEDIAINKLQEQIYPIDNWKDTNLLNYIKQLTTGGGLETSMSEALHTFHQIKNTMYVDDYDNLDDLFNNCDNMSCLVKKYWDVEYNITPTATDYNSRIIVNINNMSGSQNISHSIPSKKIPYTGNTKYFNRLTDMKHNLLPSIFNEIINKCDMYFNEVLWDELKIYKSDIKFLKNRISESIRMFSLDSPTNSDKSMYHNCDLISIVPLLTVDSISSFKEYIHNYNSNALFADVHTFYNSITEKIVGLYTTQVINGVTYPVPVYGQIETQLLAILNTVATSDGLRSLYDVIKHIELIDKSFNSSDFFSTVRYKLFKNLPNIIKNEISKALDAVDDELEMFMMVYDIRMVQSNSSISSAIFFDLLDDIFEPMLSRNATEITPTIYDSVNRSVESFLKSTYPLMFFNYIYEFGLTNSRNKITTGTISGYTIREYNTNIHLSTILKRDTAVISNDKSFLPVDMENETDKKLIYLNSLNINSSLMHYDYHSLDYDIDYDYDSINITKPITLMHKNNASFISKLKSMSYDVIYSEDMNRRIHKQIIDRLTSINLFDILLCNNAGYNKSLLNYQSFLYYSQLDDEYYLSFDIYKYYPKGTIDEIQNVLDSVNTLDHTHTKVLESVTPIDKLSFQSTSSWDIFLDKSTLKLNGDIQCSIYPDKRIDTVINQYTLYESKKVPNDYKSMLTTQINMLDNELLHKYNNYNPPQILESQHFGIIDNSKYNDLFLYYDMFIRFRAINQINIGNFDLSLDLVYTLYSYELKNRLKQTANSDSLFYTLINA